MRGTLSDLRWMAFDYRIKVGEKVENISEKISSYYFKDLSLLRLASTAGKFIIRIVKEDVYNERFAYRARRLIHSRTFYTGL